MFFSNESSKEEIRDSIVQFRLASKPVAEVNFSEIYGNSGQFQILHPLLSLKKLKFTTCQNCSEKQVQADEDLDVVNHEKEKRRQLEFFLSGSAPLPNDFFLKPPFADQQGSSYAYLISMYPALLSNEKAWVEQHLSFFKISELKEVIQKYKIDDLKFSIISHLNEREVESVIRGEEIILTSAYVLFKDQDRLGFSPLSYLVYSASDFNQFIKIGKFEVTSELENAVCILKIGNSCWT